ncbi:MAG: hypothetical protein WAU44_03685 [Nitrospira sp.]|jgi:hypothetical protein|uniref:hypothetical protein n=1 Tax=Nitrospira sp. ND1 TaxID=1658518 RepID=UPI0009B95151|nr:hypothetical protein [Nitrospira sp. ND1]MBK7420637.1 hypothetical protein [Nitrospira sp.]OYT22124.1 MAG: hypothetical protein CCU27_16120 [Nitrospira sp. UW-LDO-02]MBK7485831.1 hypothetical protein [Nitrospira sp.]MBK8378893.1 hypothetical protein [Nitrospira sp.]MBK9996215.1 hypothetical protein [Nitrospira sp.]
MTRRLMSWGWLLLVALPLTAQAEEAQQSDLLLQRIQFTDTARESGSSAIPFSIASPVLHASFQTTSFAPPTASTRLKDLVPDSERPQTKGVVAASTFFKGQLTTEGEVANNATNDAGIPSRIDQRDDGTKRMVRMALTGTNGQFRYGINYRSAGKAFFNSPDQTVREMWGEWGMGIAKLRSSSGQTWNNVDLDPTRARIQHTFNRIGLAVAKTAWPELSLTYTRSALASSFDPSGSIPQRSQSNSMEAALSYTGLTWNARLSSSYILTNDETRGGSQSTAFAQTLVATYRPMNTLTLAPTLSYRTETQSWSGATIQTPMASLSLLYKQSQRLLVSAMGGYTSTSSSDGLIDTNSIVGKGMFALHLAPIYGHPTTISLEAAYTNTTNRTVAGLDTEDLSGLVRILVASL